MKIGVIGAGRVGSGLARFWVAAGHDVSLSGSRDEKKLEAVAGDVGAGHGPIEDVAVPADVVVIAVPWQAVPDALAQAGSLSEKVVIDATNNLSDERSAFAVILRLLPGARLVKAFNSAFAALYAEMGPGKARPDMVYAGDDPEAKSAAATMIADAHFNPVDVGGSEQAANIESFAEMVIKLAFAQGRGPFAYRFVPPSDL